MTSLQKLSENNRLARWALFLQPYKFKITDKKGETLTAADAISRMDQLPSPGDEWEDADTMVYVNDRTRTSRLRI
jgi:hypothetical protein